MNIFIMLLIASIVGLAGCSDRQDETGGEDKASLIEKPGELVSQLGDQIDKSAADVGQAVSEAVDEAKATATEAVESVKESGSKMVDAVAEQAATLTKSQAVTQQSGDVTEQGVAVASARALDGETAQRTEEIRSIAEAKDLTEQPTADSVADDAKAIETAGLEAGAMNEEQDPNVLAQGKTIYAKHCMACHAAGVAGSPKVGDTAVWSPRIVQGMDVLNEHAIKGFKGSTGYMPPKGGFGSLNDDEVKAAVAYMVSASK